MSLGTAIIDTLKGNFVSQQEKTRRLNICNGCDKKSKARLGGRMTDTCGECGCFLQWKTSMPQEICPLNKW